MQRIDTWWQNEDTVRRVLGFAIDTGKIDSVGIRKYLESPERFADLFHKYKTETEAQITPVNPQPIHFMDDRFYPIGTGWYPSNTTILWAYPSPQLVNWIGTVGNEAAEIRKVLGGERGSNVHDALQNNAPVQRSKFDDFEWLSLMKAKEFFTEYGVEMVFNEQVVWDDTRKVAGRFDRIVRMGPNKKITLIDFKTGHVGREAWLQLAIMRQEIFQTMGFWVDSWGIVQLKSSSKKGWKYVGIEDRPDVGSRDIEEVFKEDLAVFDSVHGVWKDAFRNLKPHSFRGIPPDEIDLSVPIFHEASLKKAVKVRKEEKEEQARLTAEADRVAAESTSKPTSGMIAIEKPEAKPEKPVKSKLKKVTAKEEKVVE